MSFLENIESPTDLRQLNEKDLPVLADEIREFLYHSLNQSGGHFGAGLGVVELTIALHYLYDTPNDNLIWDVGHQAYPHKLLTNRKHLLHTIRQKDGLAPFPRIGESPYDCFGVGHSSTSIGAALGMSIANKLKQTTEKSIAVIGGGAWCAGVIRQTAGSNPTHNIITGPAPSHTRPFCERPRLIGSENESLKTSPSQIGR